MVFQGRFTAARLLLSRRGQCVVCWRTTARHLPPANFQQSTNVSLFESSSRRACLLITNHHQRLAQRRRSTCTSRCCSRSGTVDWSTSRIQRGAIVCTLFSKVHRETTTFTTIYGLRMMPKGSTGGLRSSSSRCPTAQRSSILQPRSPCAPFIQTRRRRIRRSPSINGTRRSSLAGGHLDRALRIRG